MAFSEDQQKILKAKLNGKYVKTREQDGKTLSYIEGWRAIAEANRIFGFDAWDRETVHVACVWQGASRGMKACSYVARVRVCVRAGETIVVREGCGSGHGRGPSLGEAHESAIKQAETDAMKRALATFGNPFGLALYDSEQLGVRRPKQRKKSGTAGSEVSWIVLSPTGQPLSEHRDPVEYCSDVRKQLESIDSADEAMAFWKRNQGTVAQLRQALPNLRTEQGQHYAEILSGLFTSRLERFAEQKGVSDERQRRNKARVQIQKSELPIGSPRRVRDKEHLRFVASQPCFICGRRPSQAHHLQFAQPRAMGRKTSDEWVVPLCATDHRSLHDFGAEKGWWEKKGVNPSKEAERLWMQSHDLRKSA